jgi:hypothetical protein
LNKGAALPEVEQALAMDALMTEPARYIATSVAAAGQAA